MGQAKVRGTFEQRKQQAIIRDTQRRKELERIRIEKWRICRTKNNLGEIKVLTWKS